MMACPSSIYELKDFNRSIQHKTFTLSEEEWEEFSTALGC